MTRAIQSGKSYVAAVMAQDLRDREIAAKNARDRERCLALLKEADQHLKRARRLYIAGAVMLALAAALLCATAAGADTVKTWGHNVASHVELHEPTAPGAVASITFKDALVHASSEAFTLTLNGLSVTFHIEHMGADPGERLHIAVPDGYVVWPDVLQPGENETGTAHVYPPGVGM